MRILKLLVAAALAANVVAPVAYAQNTACTCQTTGADGEAVGRFLRVQGNVLASGTGDYVPAQTNAPVLVNSEVQVGARSSAAIIVGQGCNLSLDANTITRISRLADGNLCVAQSGNAPAADVAGSAGGSGVPTTLLLVAGGGGIIALLVTLGKGNDPVSR